MYAMHTRRSEGKFNMRPRLIGIRAWWIDVDKHRYRICAVISQRYVYVRHHGFAFKGQDGVQNMKGLASGPFSRGREFINASAATG